MEVLMKKIIFIFTFFSLPVFALPVSCTITDSNGLNETIVHDINLNAHGPLDRINNSEVATGFISSSNGHIVISLTNRETEVTLSTTGSPINGKEAQSQAIYAPDSWINVNCR